MGLGQLASDLCWRLSLTLHAKMFFRCSLYRNLVGNWPQMFFNYVKLWVGAVESRSALTKFKCQHKYWKGEIFKNVRFSENFDFFWNFKRLLLYESSARESGWRFTARSTYAIGSACVPGVLAAICDFVCKNWDAVDVLLFILRNRNIILCHFLRAA